MRVIKFDPTAPVLRGWNPDEDLSVNFRRDDSVTGGTTTGPFVLGDMQHTTTVADTVVRSWQWDIATPLGSAQSELVNLSPALVSITGDRVVSVGTGKAQLRATSPIGSRDYSLDASIAAGTTYDLAGYQAGSLAANVDALMRSLFLGQTLNNTTAFLSTGWPPSYPANTSRIAPSLDLTPVSLLRQPVGETGWTPLYPDLLISPRHGLVTAHAAGAVGDQVLFRRPDNSLQWVTRIGLRSIGSDTAVVYYDQPVTGITPAKLAPSNMASKFPNLAATTGAGGAWFVPGVHLLFNSYPHLGLDPGRKVLVTTLDYRPTGFRTDRWLWFKRVTGTDFEPYGVHVASLSNSNDGIRGGDSGSLLALPVQETAGGPIVMMWTSLCAGPLLGPDFSLLLDLINAEMNAQAGTAPGTYSVTTANLARFTNY